MKNKSMNRAVAFALAALVTATSAQAVMASDFSQYDVKSVPELKLDVDSMATAKDNGIKLPKLKGKLKLKVSVPIYQLSSAGTQIQKLWQEAMEHYLGCKLDIEWSETNFMDYGNNELVVLQSGQLPDIATVTKGSAVNEYGEDGLLLNLADYTDYMKYYPDYMAETSGGENFAKMEDGSMYTFMDGFYNPDDIQGAQSFTAFAYRFDVLKKLGLTPAETLDEFTELCKTLKEKIDDGEIEAQYPIMNSTMNYSLVRGFVGIFHTWDVLYYNDGEWKFGPLEDNYREMLKYVNSLYEAGYIDPEFATADENAATTKATTGVGLICPTLWSGMARTWTDAATVDGMEWGLAFLPTNETYGTPWKWGSRQPGKSLNANMGIYISAETKNPEYTVAMIDYQYSDEMVNLMNWGVEGQTYTVAEDGTKTFVDDIMNAEEPVVQSSNYGLTAASQCRPGIAFNPIDFDAMLQVASKPEAWWNPTDGFYEGKYWTETDKNGGEESVAPYDRPPVTYLTSEEEGYKAELSYEGVCDKRARELSVQFITGQMDINDDKDWEAYKKDVMSQTTTDFNEIIDILNEKTVTE